MDGGCLLPIDRVVDPGESKGKAVTIGAAEDEKLAAIEQDNWPHAFAKYDCDMETFIQAMSCNHTHGTYGNWVRELGVFCRAADIEFVDLSK